MAMTDIFIKRPVLAVVVNLLILLIGARAAVELPIREYPYIESGTITVSTSYPGASPSLMQGFVTTPIAQAIATAEGVEYITSTSRQGVSSVSARLRLNADTDRALTDIMTKVGQVSYLIPQEANDPVIAKSSGESTAIMYVGFSSEEIPLPGITDYIIRVVQPLVSTVNGVGGVEIIGGQTLAMRVWLDPAKMASRNLTATDVAGALRANNYQSAPGQMKGGLIVANIDATTDITDVEDFRDLIVKEGTQGDIVRLRDIATVELGATSYDQEALMDGNKAVYIGVQSTPTGNPLTIVRDVRQILEKLEPEMPPSMSVGIPFDVSIFIQGAIKEVGKTLIEAMLIVVVVIFLFLGTFRSVIIPIVTIPLSLIGACVLLLACGFSINLLTLLAMVMAIGLVVDDAIVVVENIYRHIEEGEKPFAAAINGAREIVGPIIAMTITLAAVYAPIGFMGGLTGSLFREFAFTLAGAVIISGVVAITLSPMMCSKLLKHGMNDGPFARRVDKTFSAVENWYAKRLVSTIKFRPVTMLVVFAVLGSLYFLYNGAQKELAPEEDKGVVVSILQGPEYANIDYMSPYAKQLQEIFKSTEEIGSSFILTGTDGTNQGFGGFTLKPWEDRDKSAKDIQGEIQQKVRNIDGINVFVIALPPLPGSTGGMPVQMVIRSTDDPTVIFANMEKLKAEATKSGMFIVTNSDLTYNTPTVNLTIDSAKANQLGIRLQDIGDTLTLLLGGNYVNRFSYEGRSYEVIPQVPRLDRLTPQDLTSYYVRSRDGSMVPLSTVVNYELVTQPKAVLQFNQLNSATFQAVPLPGVSIGQALEFLQGKAKEILPEGYTLDYEGDSRQYIQEGNQLAVTFVFALIIIFLVLAAQFESLRDPLVIMMTVPLALSGALLPLFFGVTSVNIYSQIGLVTLIGLISKHGILMVEFANKLQEQGMDKVAAIQEAAKVRLRPILMTTAAMVAGLMPLVFSSGPGAASRFSIGLMIVVGMLIGTLFTLFILPAIYTLIAKTHRHEDADGEQTQKPTEKPAHLHEPAEEQPF